MSVAKSEEERHRAEAEAKEFESLLDEESFQISNVVVRPVMGSEALNLGMMSPQKAREELMTRVKRAFLVVMKFNNLTGKKKIDLFDKLMNYVEKFKNLLEEYGSKIDVESFSIEVGFPFGISISFTFKPKHKL
jgi:hypothetical protein